MNAKDTTTVAICLRLATASHRKRFIGIFKAIGAAQRWNLRIIPDERELADLLTVSSALDAPDGIISGVPYSDATQEAIAKSSIPFVGIGNFDGLSSARHKAIGFVRNDDRGIGVAAAEYFLANGAFRSFAYIPDTQNREWSRVRGNAFKARLSQAGMQCLTYGTTAARTDCAATTLGSFLSTLRKPAAVFAAWDGRGADVLAAAQMAGISIPNELSVIGVDNDEIICEHTQPPLSSVITDAEGMGEAAARELTALMAHRSAMHRRKVVCPILGIAERESTKPPSPASRLIDRALSFIAIEAKNGITPNDVAKHLSISRRLLDLRFRQYEGGTVHKRIVETRLSELKRLLNSSNISVRSAFGLSGFGNTTHAYRLFKRLTGLTPESWREAHNAKPESQDRCMNHRTGFTRLQSLCDRDADDICALVRELDGNATFNREAVATAIKNGGTRLYAIRKQRRIVASAAAVSFATPTGLHCRIEDVIVSSRERGHGLGRTIMENVLRDLKKEGFRTVELTSRPARTAANALYRSLGFKLRETNVYVLPL